MKIGILGANGLVGKFLVQSLSSNFDVVPVTRYEVDLRNLIDLERYLIHNTFDILINAATDSNSSMNEFNANSFYNNFLIFSNLYNLKNHFGKLINFGSGAEFDRRQSISFEEEESIFKLTPVDHYGLAKNLSSRISFTTPNFYTLRLFGLFYQGEPARRLLSKIKSYQPVLLEDKYFDYFYLEDLLPVVRYYIEEETPKFKDVNVVYPTKIKLSSFVRKFCEVKNMPSDHVSIGRIGGYNYTGSSTKIDSLNFKITELEKAFEKY